jgi:hypothetical protein
MSPYGCDGGQGFTRSTTVAGAHTEERARQARVGAIRCAGGLAGEHTVVVAVLPCSATHARHRAEGTNPGVHEFQQVG